jgi:hypothetical protein
MSRRKIVLAMGTGAMALSMLAPAAAQASTATSATAATAAHAMADPCFPLLGRWFCYNRANAPVYGRGTNPPIVGRMQTTLSWFICRKEGARNNNGPHPNRWLWTQADNGAWGWMRDGDISSETNPVPAGNCPP